MAETRLVPMDEKFLETTFQWLQSPELRAQIDMLAAPTPETHRQIWRERLKDKTRRDFAILDPAGRHAGNCGLSGICPSRRKAELWIYVAAAHGAGIGGKALRILLGHAFSELGLERVHLRVLSTNPKAIRFYEKNGFTREGVARHDSLQGGRPVDSVLFSILASEFQPEAG